MGREIIRYKAWYLWKGAIVSLHRDFTNHRVKYQAHKFDVCKIFVEIDLPRWYTEIIRVIDRYCATKTRKSTRLIDGIPVKGVAILGDAPDIKIARFLILSILGHIDNAYKTKSKKIRLKAAAERKRIQRGTQLPSTKKYTEDTRTYLSSFKKDRLKLILALLKELHYNDSLPESVAMNNYKKKRRYLISRLIKSKGRKWQNLIL